MTARNKSETTQIKNVEFVMFLLHCGQRQSVILSWIDASEQVRLPSGADVHKLRKNGVMP